MLKGMHWVRDNVDKHRAGLGGYRFLLIDRHLWHVKALKR